MMVMMVMITTAFVLQVVTHHACMLPLLLLLLPLLLHLLLCRPGSRGMMQRYLPAQLRVAKGELQRGLAGHSYCPDFLTKWLRGDALNTYLSLA
jgi:hypothetical protein